MQAFRGSISIAQFLVRKGLADVNAAAANTGLTPLMCSALCGDYPDKVSTLARSYTYESHDGRKPIDCGVITRISVSAHVLKHS